VPAAAVIQKGQVLCIRTGRKGGVGGISMSIKKFAFSEKKIRNIKLMSNKEPYRILIVVIKYVDN